jgi:hypothetical protein
MTPLPVSSYRLAIRMLLGSALTCFVACQRPSALFQPATPFTPAPSSLVSSTPAADRQSQPLTPLSFQEVVIEPTDESQQTPVASTSSHATAPRTIGARMTSMKQLLVTPRQQAASPADRQGKRVTLAGRMVLKRMNKQLGRHLAPQRVQSVQQTGDIMFGIAILIGLLALLAGSWAIGLIALLLGGIGSLLSFIGMVTNR